ncbi:MAG: HlyC/CorC family transporter [Firmicutes bacterium]|nr:HlyC/CorC family transporter [Bacillota bacterium]
MDSSYWNQIILIFVLISFNAFFAGSEIAMISLRQSRIRQLVDRGSRSARVIEKLMEDPSRFLATIQVGVTLTGFLASATAAVGLAKYLSELIKMIPLPFLTKASDGLALVLVTLLVSYISLVLGELVPKRVALQKAEMISLFVARPIEILSTIAAPFVFVLTKSTNFLVKLLGGEEDQTPPRISEEEIRMMVAEQPNIMEVEKEMIEGVFEFGDTVAREIMIPRTDIRAIHRTATIGEAIQIMATTGYSRLPVYEENIDDIIGIITLKDLIPFIVDTHRDQPITEHIRPVYVIPESKNVVELLKELQRSKQHMAIVLDEYGGTAGLITIEDLLEEIVGDIMDEHDELEEHFEMIGDHQYVVDARLNVEEANEILAMDLPLEEHYETIGGLVLHYLGKIPQVGDEVKLEQTTISVTDMDGNRITRVKITKDQVNKSE